MPEGRVVEDTFQNFEFTEEDFDKPTFMRGLNLFACNSETAPEYKDSSIRLLLVPFVIF
jgi:hypothetical protein